MLIKNCRNHVKHNASLLQFFALYTLQHSSISFYILHNSSMFFSNAVDEQLLCLFLSLCCVFSVFPLINVSQHPYWLLIYESCPTLSLLSTEGSIDGPICQVCHRENCLVSKSIMNILLTSFGRQHLRMR